MAGVHIRQAGPASRPRRCSLIVAQLRRQQAMCLTAVLLGVAWDHAVDFDSLTSMRVEIDDDHRG